MQCVGQFSLLFIALQVGMTAALASVLSQTQIYFTALWGLLLCGVRIILSCGKYNTKPPDYRAIDYIVWSSVFGAIGYMIIVVFAVPDTQKWLSVGTWQSLTLKTWLSVLFVGWFSTLVGYSLWTGLLKRHHANQVAPFSLGVPVIGLLAGLLWVYEPIDGWQWLGTVFVGVALILIVCWNHSGYNERKNEDR